MHRLKLYLFGPPHIEVQGRFIDVRLRKALALLTYLAVMRQSHTRDTLAAMFWLESNQQTSRANLRRTLYYLNKSVGEGVLAISAEQIGIDPQTDIWTDIDVIKNLVTDCVTNQGSTVADHSGACLARLSEASNLYAGDFMAGFNLPDCPEFDEWQFFQREHLRQIGLQVLDYLVAVYQDQGRFQQALSVARRRLSFDRLHESTHRRLMQLYLQTGQKAAALRQYEECVRILEAELGATPQPKTVQLRAAVTASRIPARMADSAIIPKTHYVKSGEVYIAYQVIGDGPIDILFVSGFVSHLEQLWREPGLASFCQQLAEFSRLILFDKRGVGLSDRVGYPPSLENTCDDIQAVMDAAGSKAAVLFGVSEGGPAIIRYAVNRAQSVQGLILYGTMAKGSRSKSYPFALTREQYDTWLGKLIQSWGSPAGIEYFAPSRAKDPVLREWWAAMLRLGASPGSVRMVLEVLRDIDVRHLLSKVHIPALVIHRRYDQVMRVAAGRYLAEHIPENRYVELDGADHWWWVGDTEVLLEEIKSFVKVGVTP